MRTIKPSITGIISKVSKMSFPTLTLFCLSFFLLFQNTYAIIPGTVPGSTDGTFDITPNGAAAFSVPINIIPGLGGIQPELSVSYSSNGTNGLLGVGWQLNGVSTITRCRPTIAQDLRNDNIETINTNNKREYCLDGQRLIEFDYNGDGGPICGVDEFGTNTYGREFRTEIDSFARIFACPDPSPSSSGQAFKFKVWTKSGLIKEYGYTDDSRLGLFADFSPESVLTWGINKVSDTKGNYFTVSYFNKIDDSGTITAANPSGAKLIEFWPIAISYTSNDSSNPVVSPRRFVLFKYEDRPDQIDRYVNGYNVTTQKRLKSIQSWFGEAGGLIGGNTLSPSVSSGFLVREYTLTYSDSISITNRSLLMSITECGFDNQNSTPTCLEPTTFNWNKNPLGFAMTQDSGADASLIDFSKDQEYVHFIDVNGDGADDLVYPQQAISNKNLRLTYRVRFGNPNVNEIGSDPFQNAIELDTGVSTLTSQWAHPIDWNHDGIMDLILPNNFTSNLSAPAVMPGIGKKWVVMQSVVPNGVFSHFELINTGNTVAGVRESLTVDGNILIGDFNGDGMHDLMYTDFSDFNKLKILTGDQMMVDGLVTPYFNGPLNVQNSSSIDLTGKVNYFGLHNSNKITSRDQLRQGAFDFNNDGRTDLTLESGNGTCTFWMSIKKSRNRFRNVAGGAGNLCSLTIPMDINGDGYTDLVFLDDPTPGNNINRGTWSAFLNTGIGFSNKVALFPSQFMTFEMLAAAVPLDYNGDGMMDLLVPEICSFCPAGQESDIFIASAWQILISTGREFVGLPIDSEILPAPVFPYTRAIGMVPMYAPDINGDGLTDLMFAKSTWQTSLNKAYIPATPDPDVPTGFDYYPVPNDVINTITSGLGVETKIHYAPLTKQDSGNNNGVYKKNSQAQFPIQDFIGSIYVAQLTKHKVNDITSKHVKYRYQGARINMQGRGFLGFDSVTARNNFLDPSRFSEIRTIYEHKFPLTGLVKSQMTRVAGSTLIDGAEVFMDSIVKLDIFTWNYRESKSSKFRDFNNGGFSNVKPHYFFPYMESIISLTTEPAVSGETTISRKITTMQNTGGTGEIAAEPFDEYGNPEQIQEVFQVDTATQYPEGYTRITQNTYDPKFRIIDDDNWIVGRLSTTEVWTTAPNELSDYRKSTFSYYGKASTDKGLLECSIEAPDNSLLKLQTCTKYDDWGNTAEVTVTGFDGQFDDTGKPLNTAATSERITRSDYNGSINDNQQLLEVSNSLGHKETRRIDAKTGLTTRSNDANNFGKSWEYDGLGRKTRVNNLTTTGAVQNSTVFTYHKTCMDVTFCPPNTALIKTSQNFSLTQTLPPTVTFLNAFSLPIRNKSTSFDNREVCQDITYKNTGIHSNRIDKTSKKFACQNQTTSLATQLDYDLLGRIVKQTNPDGSEKTNRYGAFTVSGRPHTTKTTRIGTDIEGAALTELLTQTEYFNSQGNRVQTDDALNGKTKYSYDSYGNLISVTRQDDNGTPFSTKMMYDARGNKVSMDDPDMGVWLYRYNGFGELVWQKDAKGQIIKSRYDSIGRLITRTETDSSAKTVTTFWVFDTAIDGIGKLAKVCKPYVNGCTPDVVGGHQEIYGYDNKSGLLNSVSLTIEGHIYNTEKTYDSLYRVSTITYPQSGSVTQRLAIRHIYKSTGFLQRVENAANSAELFWEANESNIESQITKETYGNGLITNRTFDPRTNFIKRISTGTSGQTQNLIYGFDSQGNLNLKTDHNQTFGVQIGVTERFRYDLLNRLSEVAGDNIANHKNYDYDSLGNIKYKSDIGYYTYGQNGAGPHAVTSITPKLPGTSSPNVDPGDANADHLINRRDIDQVAGEIIESSSAVPGSKPDCTTDGIIDVRDLTCINTKILASGGNLINRSDYRYDANGNTVQGAGRITSYTAFNKPTHIQDGDTLLNIQYGANRARISQSILHPNGTTSIHYVGKLFETKTTLSGIEYNNFISIGSQLVAIKSYAKNTEKIHFVHIDHLGSIDLLTNTDQTVNERFSYDPFGKRRESTWVDTTAILVSAVTTRSFTGHEVLTVGLVHMNGRVYDPEIGRFISADPTVQFPDNSQSFNRYSYVLNNPLSFTDPSGFGIVNNALNAVADTLTPVYQRTAKFFSRTNRKYGTQIKQIAITALLVMAGVPEFAAAFSGTFVASDGDIKAAFISSITATMFSTLHGTRYGINKVMAHGFVGGVSNVIAGGNFKEGFFSAAVTQGFSPLLDKIDQSNIFANAVAAATIGGTAAAMGGGKFGNGAVTGAFSRLFNDLNDFNSDDDILGGGSLSEINESLIINVETGQFVEIPQIDHSFREALLIGTATPVAIGAVVLGGSALLPTLGRVAITPQGCFFVLSLCANAPHLSSTAGHIVINPTMRTVVNAQKLNRWFKRRGDIEKTLRNATTRQNK